MGKKLTKKDFVAKVVFEKTLYIYDFDLTDGIVQEDILSAKDGFNYTKALGLTSPCSFDELIKRSYNADYFDVKPSDEEELDYIDLEILRDKYASGETMVEMNWYWPQKDEYNRLTYHMVEEKGCVHVYVSCVDITDAEKHHKHAYEQLRKDKSEIEDIVASANMGIWHIYLFDGEEPRMRATPKMCELLGINPEGMTEEDIYNSWYSRIKKSAIPSVTASVNEMIEKGFSENTYAWNHPTKHEIFVRCGGTSKKVEGKGYILRGYHSDVTDTVTAETKQKQLLADALDEVRKQKQMLQEALDNFKEADYDRRRDFLTGLRNRQDMFEMLQDVLSGKREKITSMYMMDIDNFKSLNDHYGHVYGDECLKKIGVALNHFSEENKVLFYRYGGEEILGICFDAKKEADKLAQTLVDLIGGLDIKRDDLPAGHVTVSLGYTTDHSQYETMIDKADEAMYVAKEQGKNQAVCFEKIER